MSRRSSVPGAHLKDYAPRRTGGEEVEFRSPGERAPGEDPRSQRIKWTGFLVGLALAVLVYFVLPADLAHPAKLTAATAVLLLNVLYRIGVQGDRERDREEEARRYFDEHGRWPD